MDENLMFHLFVFLEEKVDKADEFQIRFNFIQNKHTSCLFNFPILKGRNLIWVLFKFFEML